MVSTMKLMEISKKWHGKAGERAAAPCPRGHFAAYTRDGRRFIVPIAYLGSDIFRELLNLAEEEFGAPGDRPIVLPCTAACMEQILAALRGGATATKKCSGSKIC